MSSRPTTTQAPPQNRQEPFSRQPTGQAANLPAISGPRLPYHPFLKEGYNIDKSGWRVLCESIFPGAQCIESIILACAYCKQHGYDVFARIVHIVPIWNKDLGRMVDTVWPGIGLVRTTAHRSGCYAGRDETVFGPKIRMKFNGPDNQSLDLEFPEWAQITVYRIVQGVRCPFPGPKVYWLESYSTIKRNSDVPNEMWAGRPSGQLEKCAEAAALRAAFPEAVGGMYASDEVGTRREILDVEGRRISGGVIASPPTKALSDTLNERVQQSANKAVAPQPQYEEPGEFAQQADDPPQDTPVEPAREEKRAQQEQPPEASQQESDPYARMFAECEAEDDVLVLHQHHSQGANAQLKKRLSALRDQRLGELRGNRRKPQGTLLPDDGSAAYQ